MFEYCSVYIGLCVIGYDLISLYYGFSKQCGIIVSVVFDINLWVWQMVECFGDVFKGCNLGVIDVKQVMLVLYLLIVFDVYYGIVGVGECVFEFMFGFVVVKV